MKIESTITANDARFPLESLSLSPFNPRQTVAAQEIADLAETIWTAGLVQSIAGYIHPINGVEIVAGGRRLRALKLLADLHPDLAQIRPELANPLVMIAPDEATAKTWANLENVAREDLHPAEEIRAYGKMAQAGSTPSLIARAFAVTEKHVYRRLALSQLATPILDALAANEISLSMAACFTICTDEATALEVLEQCRGGDQSDHVLKRMLKPNSVKSTDRMAIFVGLEAYIEAGGKVSSDLFADMAFLEDTHLLSRLFDEKLAKEAENLVQAQSWKWVKPISEAYIGWNVIEDLKCARIYPQAVDMSEAQAERYDILCAESEAEALDEAGESELAELHALTESNYTVEQKAVAGALIHVTAAGTLSLTEGLVMPEDKATAMEVGVLAKSHHAEGATTESKSPISAKLADDLARVKTGARQNAILRHPEMVLALLAFQLTGRMGYRGAFGIRCDDVANWPTTEAEGYQLDSRLTNEADEPANVWKSDLAKEFRAFRKKGADHIAAELNRHLSGLLQVADKGFATFVDKEAKTDIREVWTPTAANFFSRVSGAYLSDLWRALLGLKADHPTVTTFEKLKKAEKAAKLETLFADPLNHKGFALTAEQTQKVKTWLPETLA